MQSAVEKQSVPLELGDDGVLRVGRTRVTLDTVISAFDAGCTCEEIAQQCPSLRLPDIYVVVGYYLSHRDELKSYLDRRQADRAKLETERPLGPGESNQTIRERLLNRRASAE